MKNFILLLALTFASLGQAANTKIPASMLSGAPRLAGESYFAGTTSCSWARTSTTIGAFTTVAACPGPTIVMSTMGTWATTDTDLPRQTITGLAAGYYKAKFTFSTYQSLSNIGTALAINDGTTTCEAVQGNTSNTFTTQTIVECTFSYASSGTRVFELYAASPSGAVNVSNSQSASPRISMKFSLEYWGNY